MSEMTDREMIEMAAKAAGIIIVDIVSAHKLDKFAPDKMMSDVIFQDGNRGWWLPQHDGGDALKLAEDVGINVDFLTIAASTNDFTQVV